MQFIIAIDIIETIAKTKNNRKKTKKYENEKRNLVENIEHFV